jgi:putative ABC transport system ATP-binding protein
MIVPDQPRRPTEDARAPLSLVTGGEPAGANLAVLERLARAAGVPFDETKAKRALRQAELDVPPTATRASRQRLAQAAQALGLQLLSRHLSVREALAVVEPETPLTLFAVGADGTARWFMLVEQRGGRGRLARLVKGDTEEFLDAEELARRIDAADADAVVEWLVAQPAAPLNGAERRVVTELEAAHGPPPFARLLGLMQPEKRDVWIVVAYAVGIGILSLATPIALMAVVNTVALATLIQQLIVLCLGLLACLAFAAFLMALQMVVVEYIQRRVFVRVAADLAYRLPRVRQDAFDRQHGPEMVNRFFAVLTVQKSAATLLLDGVDIVLSTLIGLALLASYHHVLLGFDLGLLAALAFLIYPLGRGAVATAIRESRAKYALAGWLEELARHPTAFKLSGGPHFALEQTDLLARNYLLARQQHFRIVFRQNAFALAVYALATTTLLALGGFLVIDGQLTLGQLVAAEMVVTMVVVSFTKFGKHLGSFYELLAAVEKLGHLVDLPLERDSGVTHQSRTRGAALRIHDLDFTYDTALRPVLEGFNLTVAPGERVALLGANGTGKTTLVDLIFGLRPASRGHLEIDGINYQDLNLNSLREHVAVVRGFEVFAGTVLDNVRMGREYITVADVIQALRVVGLLDNVHALPNGLQTELVTGGSLSLGQLARLMLARAIVGQPRLMIVDDVLDHLDLEARQEVLPAIMGRDANWTLLVITHSPEVAQLCDRQIRMENPRTFRPQPSGERA